MIIFAHSWSIALCWRDPEAKIFDKTLMWLTLIYKNSSDWEGKSSWFGPCERGCTLLDVNWCTKTRIPLVLLGCWLDAPKFQVPGGLEHAILWTLCNGSRMLTLTSSDPARRCCVTMHLCHTTLTVILSFTHTQRSEKRRKLASAEL